MLVKYGDQIPAAKPRAGESPRCGADAPLPLLPSTALLDDARLATERPEANKTEPADADNALPQSKEVT